MGHRCGASDIAGSSLRLPGLAEQHRWAIVAVWRAGGGPRRAWLAGAGRRGGGRAAWNVAGPGAARHGAWRAGREARGLGREPGTGSERAGNLAARHGAYAPDAVTFTLSVGLAITPAATGP